LNLEIQLQGIVPKAFILNRSFCQYCAVNQLQLREVFQYLVNCWAKGRN